MIKVDTTTLSEIVNRCFGYATDGRFSSDQQKAFLADGKRLRGLLLNLLSAQFDDGAQAVLNANKQLAAVNSELSNAVATLANVAQTANNISGLVGNLDKLLNVAVGFL